MLFGAKKKPLFGDPLERYGSPQATPGIGDGIGHTPEMRQAAQPTPQAKPGLGTRLFGKGWEDKAFALGGIMQGDPSGVMMMRRDQQMQQQAAADAAAAQRKRAQELADWQWKQEWERDNPKASENVGVFEDNAGNRWTYDKSTGAPIGDKPVFVDNTPKEFVHEGMRFSIPNRYATGQAGDMPTVSDEASYNAVPPGAQYRDSSGNVRTKQGGPTQPASGSF